MPPYLQTFDLRKFDIRTDTGSLKKCKDSNTKATRSIY